MAKLYKQMRVRTLMTLHYQNAETYSQNNNLQYQFALKILAKTNIQPQETILDIGCGDGLITHEIAQKHPTATVTGIDISKPMIEFATNKYANIQNLQFICMDASSINLANKFNLIVSFNALHWMKNQDTVIQGMANSLADNGEILLLFSHKKSAYHYALDKTCSNLRWESYFKSYVNPRVFFDKTTYANILTHAGFKIKNIIEEEMTHYFDSKEKLKGFYRGSLTNLTMLPDELKEIFLSDLANEYLTRLNIQSNEKIPVSFWCLQIEATRTKEQQERD